MDKVKVAILVDGSFFLMRYRHIFNLNIKDIDPKKCADIFYSLCYNHLEEGDYLYKILYYDCVPLETKTHQPISGLPIDFKYTETAIFRNQFFKEISRKRKVALRLGYLKESNSWIIKPDTTRMLINNELKVEDLRDDDFFYDVTQKGTDIKIGIDIKSLATKRLVDKVILISGDGDFLPAAKLARREGIDFVLDPMWNHIDEDLYEHIDGLKTTIKKPSYYTE